MMLCTDCRKEVLGSLAFFDSQMIRAAAVAARKGEVEAATLNIETALALSAMSELVAGHEHADAAARLHTLRELVRMSDLMRPDIVCILRDRGKELKEWANGK